MGRIGKIIKSFVGKLSGSGKNAQLVAIEEFAGDERNAQVFGPCNEDFAPPDSVKTIDMAIGDGRGLLVTTSYSNEAIEPVAIEGERRIYSTNEAGDVVMAEAFLKQDGTIYISNGAVSFTATPAGVLTISTPGGKTIFEDDVEFNGNIENNGINIGDDHKHSGVQPGLGISGNPI